MNVKIKKIRQYAVMPRMAHETDSGYDLFSTQGFILLPGQRRNVPLGIVLELPKNTEGQIRGRSGLAFGYGLAIVHGVGTIDQGYRGEIYVCLINHGDEPKTINIGDKIAQLVIQKVYRPKFKLVKQLSKTKRGKKGFGSTGK